MGGYRARRGELVTLSVGRPGGRARASNVIVGVVAILCAVSIQPIAGAKAADPFAPAAPIIAGGARAVNTDAVTLTIPPPADAANRIRISDDGATWLELDWTGSVPWSLSDPAVGGIPGDGTKTVALEYGDGTTWSLPSTAVVILDTTPPVVDTVQAVIGDPTRDGWWGGVFPQYVETGSGIAFERISLDGAEWSDWFAYGTGGNFDLRNTLWGGDGSTGVRTIWIQGRDGAGNVSNAATDTVTIPDDPVEAYQAGPVRVRMLVPTPPVTGESFTLRPAYPRGYKLPADAICQWNLEWGSEASFLNGPDRDYGQIMFDRAASQGGCGDWTFTLPYTGPRLYRFWFDLLQRPTGPPEYSGVVTLGSVGNENVNTFRAGFGTTEQRILRSNIPITYVLPASAVPSDVGQPTTYRFYTTDGSPPPQSGIFWAYSASCYINPQLHQYGGTSFTYRPPCSGSWVTGWSGTYHGYYMRNEFDPLVDGRAPAVRKPSMLLVPGYQIGATARVRLAWFARDTGSGVYLYQAQLSRNGHAYVPLVLPNRLAISVDRTLALTGTYRLRMRARDRSGNWSPWYYGDPFTVRTVEDTNPGVQWSQGWTSAAASTWSGGSDRQATGAGDTASLAFTGRSIGWISSVGPDRGMAQVLVDGKLAAVVDLRATSDIAKRVVFVRTWTVAGKHSIEIRLLGTASRPRVDVDAFAVLR